MVHFLLGAAFLHELRTAPIDDQRLRLAYSARFALIGILGDWPAHPSPVIRPHHKNRQAIADCGHRLSVAE
jgi:hypothetical protein